MLNRQLHGELLSVHEISQTYPGAPRVSKRPVLGDRPPHVWTLRRGPLPPDYVLSENGRIDGTCNQPGRYALAP